jgi:hypothetical protein
VNRSRDKGTSWESAVGRFLQASGWPHAELRARNGAQDPRDIPGVVIEAKNEKRLSLAEYLREAEAEAANANATVAACWIKRRGKTSPSDGYVVMSGQQFLELLGEAGY